jgi:thioredoxin reductase
LLGTKGEVEFRGRGVSTAQLHAGFFKNMHVAVIGREIRPIKEANNLTKFASKVAVISSRREEFVRQSGWLIN